MKLYGNVPSVYSLKYAYLNGNDLIAPLASQPYVRNCDMTVTGQLSECNNGFHLLNHLELLKLINKKYSNTWLNMITSRLKYNEVMMLLECKGNVLECRDTIICETINIKGYYKLGKYPFKTALKVFEEVIHKYPNNLLESDYKKHIKNGKIV